MFYGGNNPLEGGYVSPPTEYSYSPSQIGYINSQQLPPSIPYPNTSAFISPIYYLPPISPSPHQGISTGTPIMSNNFNNLSYNLPPSNVSETFSSNSIKSIEETPTIITPPPTEECNFIKHNIKTKDGDNKPQQPINKESSTLLVTDRFAVKLEPNKYIHGIPATKWYTLSDQEREEVLRTQRRITSYKTALCVSFRVKGSCSFGDNCRFAHSLEELKPPPVRHPKYKTQLCDKFSATGICPYGSRCNFIHATKNGEVVPDNKEDCLVSEKENNFNYCDEDSDSDEEGKRSFAVSMNSIPKRYRQVGLDNIDINGCNKLSNDNNKPPQVINFSKSFGGPVIRTLYEKGRLLNDNIKNDNNGIKKKMTKKCCDNINIAIDNLPKAPSPPYINNCNINETEKKKKDDNKMRNDIFKKLFLDRNNYERINDVNGKVIEEDFNEVEYSSTSHSQTSNLWKKHSFYNKNTGYYSQSKLPTFLKFNNT
uniref:C3H1-type domain-containing protein n=1 Tax=Strongyloides stercoralis TaxID=6248 RepID=A0A0K0ET80_STRER